MKRKYKIWKRKQTQPLNTILIRFQLFIFYETRLFTEKIFTDDYYPSGYCRRTGTMGCYSSPLNFLRFLLVFKNRSRDAIVFIGGETLSAHSARPLKMPGWIVPVRQNFSVNKRVCRKQTIEIVLRGFLSVFFFKFYIWLSRLSSKKVETNSIDFLTGARKKF